jgi:hypothetical protein
MSPEPKQLSSSASTGGLGTHFENRVQASFVVLMLTGGFAPCLKTWPITKIKLQGRYQNFDTDDLIVYTKQPGTDRQAKLLGQIKHTISLTKGNKVFGEVIQAAWNDFNNKDDFTKGTDAIALICGPLSATDTDDVRALLRQAEHSEDASDFIKRVKLGKFTSDKQRDKLEVFEHHLKVANNNIDLTDDQLYRFLKSYRLLIYDLDIKGVTLSLLHSLIGQYSSANANALWTQVINKVEWESENAGFITIESIPENIRSAFEMRPTETTPSELSRIPLPREEIDWNQSQYASELAIANLLGSWYKKSDADIVIAGQLAQEDFSTWISKFREILQQPESPVALKNGLWRVGERKELWQALGPRLFDENLDIFKQCVVAVLTERDPMFDLLPEDRYAASIHGKVLEHSQHLRKGLSESLALLGSHPEALTNCSSNKPGTIAVLAVREILKNADWKLWGSLNNLLPLFAEAAPNEFLNIVESTLQQPPCPFDELFSQEGIGLTGGNYITGLLWALETLAWDEQFLVRVSVILGELASHDPGGNWTNRPSNSLTTIFLPWLPQTTASIEKRKVALQTIQKEVPEVAWKLLLSLLPNQQKVSGVSYKPVWRKTIPEDWTKDVTKNEYWEQVSFYADLAVEMAMNDIGKLNELISYLDNLPEPSFEKILKHLSSEDILAKPEDERLGLWTELTEFTSRHKRFADAKWALSPNIVSKIDKVAKALVPTNPMNLHHRLFSGRDFDLYEEKGDWKEQQKQLEERRQQAIKDILEYGEIDAVLQFAETVKSPLNVGHSLGFVAKPTIDIVILPSLLETEHKNLVQLASGYVWARHRRQGWAWVDNTDTTGWSRSQIGQFLAYLLFTEETWKRANVLLDDSENEYWSKANVNPYQADCELLLAIDKLIKYGRPNAAISCLYKILHDKQPLDKARTVQALLSAVSSGEPSHTMDTYHIVEIIKALQNAPDTDPDDLFRVEWAYLPLLDRHSGASPKLLENRLASDPDFFCEVIRLMYRSKKEPKSDKEPTEQEKAIASNAWRLLHEWKTPPGMDFNGDFSESSFKQWLKSIKKACTESGHIEVALSHVGNVLIYTPLDSDGLWINHAVAEALNSKDADEMRNGFRIGIFNSRGVHMVDPTGKPEKELAVKYRKQAEEVENAGYQRFAATLRDLADSYEREAERDGPRGWGNNDE